MKLLKKTFKSEDWRNGSSIRQDGTAGRDAAHKRIQGMLESGEGLPEGVDLKGKFIYYVGPVDAVGDEAVGPAGPTTRLLVWISSPT